MGGRPSQPPTQPFSARARVGAVTAEEVETFGRCMSVGGVALFPTDTVYGLATEPESKEGVRRLYALKGRVPDKPAAVMFFDLELALAAVPELGPRTAAALRALLPGRDHGDRAQPGAAVPAGVRARAREAGAARAAPGRRAGAAGRGSLARAPVQRQPRGRRGRAPARGRGARRGGRRGPGARRRRAARHGVHGGRPERLRAATAPIASCARGRCRRTRSRPRSADATRRLPSPVQSRSSAASTSCSRGTSGRARPHSAPPRSAAISISTIASACGPAGSMPARRASSASSAATAATRWRWAAAAAASISASPWAVLPNSSRHGPGRSWAKSNTAATVWRMRSRASPWPEMRPPTSARNAVLCSSSTARNSAFLDGKWSYSTARATPARSAISPIDVAR